jgi:hypothetical protein
MKVILELDKLDDKLELNRVMKSDEMASVIWNFEQTLKEYAENKVRKTPKQLYKEFSDLLYSKGINTDELWG